MSVPENVVPESTVLGNIDGRKWAEAVIQDLDNNSTEFQAAFWRALGKHLAPTDLDPKAMTDEEAKEFGQQTISFGKHNGETYDNIPIDYLEWLADRNLPLTRYLRSRRIRDEPITEAVYADDDIPF